MGTSCLPVWLFVSVFLLRNYSTEFGGIWYWRYLRNVVDLQDYQIEHHSLKWMKKQKVGTWHKIHNVCCKHICYGVYLTNYKENKLRLSSVISFVVIDVPISVINKHQWQGSMQNPKERVWKIFAFKFGEHLSYFRLSVSGALFNRRNVWA